MASCSLLLTLLLLAAGEGSAQVGSGEDFPACMDNGVQSCSDVVVASTSFEATEPTTVVDEASSSANLVPFPSSADMLLTPTTSDTSGSTDVSMTPTSTDINVTPTSTDTSTDVNVAPTSTDVTVTPTSTDVVAPPSTVSTPSPTPTGRVFVTLTFTQLSLEEYSTTGVADNITAVVQLIVANAVLTVDTDRSIDNTTVLRLHVPTASGGVDESATIAAYYLLATSSNQAWVTLTQTYSLAEIDLTAPTLETPPPPGLFSLPWWHWFIIGLSGALALLALVLLLSACCCRCRGLRLAHKEGQKKHRTQDHHQLAERSQLVRKVSRINFQSRAVMKSHPLSVEELRRVLANISALYLEYSSFPTNMVTMAEVPHGAEEKNRYKDVLPNPHTRVALVLKFGVGNADYINANYIRGFRETPKAYIATQGPLYWTVADFWRMVWEQRSSVIIMTTNLEERGAMKCARYWPDERVNHSTTYEDLELTLKKKISNKDYVISTFHLRHAEKMVSREVTHYWFTSWPDHGVPTSAKPLLEFLLKARKHIRDIPAPTVVHCSAGIGRTGVFIGADVGMQQLEESGEVDVLKIVSAMRQDRGGMVQTKDQYVFLHQVLLEYALSLDQMRRPYYHRTRLEATPEEDEQTVHDTSPLVA